MARFSFINGDDPCPGTFPFPVEKTTTSFAEGSLILTLEEMMYWYYKVRAIKITGTYNRSDLPEFMSDTSCSATVPVAREGSFSLTHSEGDPFRGLTPASANGLLYYFVENYDKKENGYLYGPQPPSGGWDELAFLNTKPAEYGSGCQGPMYVGLWARSFVYQYELDGGCFIYPWNESDWPWPPIEDPDTEETDPEWYYAGYFGGGSVLRADVEVSMFYKSSQYTARKPFIQEYTAPDGAKTYKPTINVSSSTIKDITLRFGSKKMVWENPNTSTAGSAEIEITPTEFWTFD